MAYQVITHGFVAELPPWLEACLLWTDATSLRWASTTQAWTSGEGKIWRSRSGYVPVVGLLEFKINSGRNI